MKPRVARWLAVLLWLSWILVGVAHAGTVTYVYTDPQGTPLAEADANGNITAMYDYTPYGSPVASLGTPPNGPGYTGHVNDPETGLVYMQARYYDPVVGRFISADPVGPGAGNTFNFNRYDYTNNNPIVNIDPNGRMVNGDQETSPCTGSHIGGGACGALHLSISQINPPSSSIKVLGQTVHIKISNQTEQRRGEIEDRINLAADDINRHAGKLWSSEKNIVQNIKNVTVDDDYRTGVEMVTGSYNMKSSYIMNPGSTSAWIASTMAHDAYHVEQFT